MFRYIDEASAVCTKEPDISCAYPDPAVTRLCKRNSNAVNIFRSFNTFELSLAITECSIFQSPEQWITFTVEGHCSECGLPQTIADNRILELSIPIPEQVRAIDADPKILLDIGHESAHGPNRRRVRQRSLNQGESKAIEADKTPFGSNPEIAIV